MNRLSAASLVAFTYLSSAISVFAQVTPGTAGTQQKIVLPSPVSGIDPNAEVGTIFGNAITIIFIVAIVLVLFFVIIGAFQWITSGGDKEKYGKARGSITHALIGLAILALAFLIVRVAGNIVNVDFFDPEGLKIPSLDYKP